MATTMTTARPVKAPDPQERVWRIAPTKADTDPVRYARGLRRRKIWLGILTPVVLLVLWETASQLGWIDAKFFPGPSHIIVAWGKVLASGQWFLDMGATLKTLGTAAVIGFVVGVLVGVVMGQFKFIRYLFEPIFSAFYTIPKIALLPLMMLIFGIGELPGNLLVGTDIFFIAWISTLEAVVRVPGGYREASEAFGVRGLREFAHVTFPAILPAVFVALRIATGAAVVITIMVEYLLGNEGIGYRIWHAWSLFDADTMYVGIVSVALLGYVLQLLVKFAGNRLVPWAGQTPGSEK